MMRHGLLLIGSGWYLVSAAIAQIGPEYSWLGNLSATAALIVCIVYVCVFDRSAARKHQAEQQAAAQASQERLQTEILEFQREQTAALLDFMKEIHAADRPAV